MTMQDSTLVFDLVLKFLSPLQRCRLLALSKTINQHLLSPAMEFEHMKQFLILTSGCWTPASFGPTSPSGETQHRTWLQLYSSLYGAMKKRQVRVEHKFEKWTWRRRPDPELDLLLRRWHYLCHQLWLDGPEYITDIGVFDLVSGNVEEFAVRALDVKICHFVKEQRSNTFGMNNCFMPLRNFIRVRKMTDEHKWPTIPSERCAVDYALTHSELDWVEGESHHPRLPPIGHFLAPLVARLVLQDAVVMDKVRGVPPRRVLEVIQGIESHQRDASNDIGYNVTDLLKANLGIFDIKPKDLWDLSCPVPPISSKVESSDLALAGLRFTKKLESHIVSEINRHLEGLELQPLNSAPNGFLIEGEGPFSVLEVSLSRSYRGPNPALKKDIYCGNVAILTLGHQTAVYYEASHDVEEEEFFTDYYDDYTTFHAGDIYPSWHLHFSMWRAHDDEDDDWA
eukprot:Blabericola_migrator_1__3029@NODE_1880_length_3610_cov_160_881174_g1203_i0_p1_GENE_NODE_1880_length_3610_cov_160_881174_g1203_i0NODE_1880_length_3610_cov_160_881174_g1203_i0_p1_ORF_typecomplete_len453_score53_24_NODE_1880_length_3610_cov_160_881174_g1203_i010142372